jgi:hypothetical protein
MRIVYRPREDITPASELSTLASIFRFVLESAKENATGLTNTNGASVRNTEEVSDVGQRPD